MTQKHQTSRFRPYGCHAELPGTLQEWVLSIMCLRQKKRNLLKDVILATKRTRTS